MTDCAYTNYVVLYNHMVISIDDKKLKNLIKESVKEALEAEFMKLRALALPTVIKKEQQDIEDRYNTPSRKRAKSYALEV